MTNKLKPCPFCRKTIAEEWFGGPDDDTYGTQSTICCSVLKGGCGACGGWHETTEKAIEAWSTRHLSTGEKAEKVYMLCNKETGDVVDANPVILRGEDVTEKVTSKNIAEYSGFYSGSRYLVRAFIPADSEGSENNG